ncbi:MAG TPA: MBL fold metallo-hydrolase [Actinomycetota bacterium]|nr:MBL fold metallo-hydrolase [Actinomycetota bacterium]
MEVAEGINRLGTQYLNFYLIEEGGKFTLVDSGIPGYYEQLTMLLSSNGKSLSDIDAVVITHHHQDHIGNAERLRRDTGGRIFVHPRDAPIVTRRERRPRANVLPFAWRPWFVRYIGHLIRNGVLRPPAVADTKDLPDGERLDIPGSPRVLHVPGHTPGSCALWLEERRVLLSDDTLVTLDTARGKRGPCILTGAFTIDEVEAIHSLDALAPLDARVMLPGHGEPWTNGVGEAVRIARAKWEAKNA